MKFLIVVDMQNDFVTGPLGTPEAQSIVPAVREKIIQRLGEGYKGIYTLDTHDNEYLDTQEGQKLPIPHCIDGTKGHEVVPELKELLRSNCLSIYKGSFCCLDWEDYFAELYGIDDFQFGVGYELEFEFVGVCTDICVISNVLHIKTLFPEAIITVDASCCAGTTPENHKAALQVMKSCQIDVMGEEA